MAYFLIAASFTLALVAMARLKATEFGDATDQLLYCLAYGFAPAAIGFAAALLNRLAGHSRTPEDFIRDRNVGWAIFVAILAAGQIVQGGRP